MDEVVTHEELVKNLTTRALLADDSQSEMLLHSFLRVLGARVSDGARENLAAQLPPQTAEYLTRDQRFLRLDAEQFLNAVWEPLADWETRRDTPAHVTAAIDLLRQSTAPGTVDKLQAQLPADYVALFEEAET